MFFGATLPHIGVIPAMAGTQLCAGLRVGEKLDPGLRRDDGSDDAREGAR